MAQPRQRPPAALTPLGMAILSLLWRQPMHPYEMRHRIRVQEIDRVMKVTHGTLYSTVGRLAASGLIQPVETSREGRRPERTVYEITDLGRDQLLDALRQGLMRAAPDYPGLATSLTFANLLDPEEVAELLERRAIEAEGQLSMRNAAMDAALKQSRFQRLNMGRVHLIETEYLIALQRAELDWLRAVVADIRDDRLSWDPAATDHVHEVRDPEGFSGEQEADDA
ncbi:MAG TPA: PadR family transcriptional regulator [Streptosporangiaceae bacterium]|nr:PadR family transcriptional regulator [Streptosporangiaceae bacterium]